ncbi:hypothetical protein FGIG_10026 [Fasciola gigantica]|uniref:UspA domain-containing protein n=1 Tax=Fasciola gigantica TaxID=46835 RepID=A0A504YYW0_FASGI|nr:hypothetical protein FGIG_10026 [Fasciola gigantica]
MPADYNQVVSEKISINTGRRVLIPIEQTLECAQTIQSYFKTIKQLNDQVIFVHIIKPKSINSLMGMRIPNTPALVGTQLQIDRESLVQAKSLCGDYVRRAATHGIPARGFVYVDSQPSAKLVRLIQSHKADLVLLMSPERRRSLMEKYVLKHTPVPVAVVPENI